MNNKILEEELTRCAESLTHSKISGFYLFFFLMFTYIYRPFVQNIGHQVMNPCNDSNPTQLVSLSKSQSYLNVVYGLFDNKRKNNDLK